MMTKNKEELMKLSEGMIRMIHAILEDPIGWLDQIEGVVDYWEAHKDIITPEIKHDLTTL